MTSPIDGSRLTTIADGGPDDMDRAVAAARAAFDGGAWSRAAPAVRKRVMHRIADRIEAEALALAVLGVRDNGTEITMALKAEPGSAAATFRWYAEAADKVPGEIAPTGPDVLALVHREPVGGGGRHRAMELPLMIDAPAFAAVADTPAEPRDPVLSVEIDDDARLGTTLRTVPARMERRGGMEHGHGESSGGGRAVGGVDGALRLRLRRVQRGRADPARR